MSLFFNVDRRGISPVIAFSLLMVVKVVAVIGFQQWYEMYSDELMADVEQRSSSVFDSLDIDSVRSGNLYLNSPDEGVEVDRISLDGYDCDLDNLDDKSLDDGLNIVDIEGLFR